MERYSLGKRESALSREGSIPSPSAMNYNDNYFSNDYCSSGYDRIIVRPNGNIVRCYSRNDVISTIYDFNENNDLVIRKCSKIDCGVCDQSNSIIHKNKFFIKNKKRQLNIQLVVTEQCKHFCPYCTHSDRAKKLNIPIAQVSIKDFLLFLDKITIPSQVVIIGGEPTLRKDLNELFQVKIKHNFLMFSSWLYSSNIDKIINTLEKYNNHLSLIPTLHPEAIGFKWDKFWKNVEKAKLCHNIHIPRLNILNYKIDEIIDKVIIECSNLNIKLSKKGVDFTVASERIDNEFLNYIKENSIKEIKSFKIL